MADRILKLRELNRATLARQMLLEREALPVPAAIERLIGLQAQLASAPYVGLWTRLRDFKRQALHATKLTLTHPRSEERLQWAASVPDDMGELMEALASDLKAHGV